MKSGECDHFQVAAAATCRLVFSLSIFLSIYRLFFMLVLSFYICPCVSFLSNCLSVLHLQMSIPLCAFVLSVFPIDLYFFPFLHLSFFLSLFLSFTLSLGTSRNEIGEKENTCNAN